MPTIAISEDIKRKLNQIKNLEGYKNMNDILEKMILLYQKTNFLKASTIFQKKMKEKKLKLNDLIENEDLNVIFFGD